MQLPTWMKTQSGTTHLCGRNSMMMNKDPLPGVGFDENVASQFGLHIYPNPASEVLFIESDDLNWY